MARGVVRWLGCVVMTGSISCLSSLLYQDKWSKNVLNIRLGHLLLDTINCPECPEERE